MKKNCLLISVCSLVSALLILSCHVGLGEAVDIKAPTISITSPVAKAQVRDNFVISGLWNDDMGLNNIKIVLENTVTKQTYPEKSSQEEIAGIANEEPGYNAVFSSDGTWTCSIKVLSETGEKIIPDGSYIAKATATDNATTPHSTSATQVFSIDNTAPVLVITSPSSTDIENPATYGKLFSIQGTYSDDSNIDSILVTILDENGNEIDGAVKTLKIKGTTIDDTVALWEGADGLYEKIYGNNIDAGTKKFYTKVTIYDSARKVPAEQGDTGNSCSYFLMQNEVEEFFSNTNEQFKTTELYSLLAGTATAGEFDPAYTNLVESINDTFENESGVKKTRAAFSLNPVNNPTFGVSGYSSFIPGVDGKETELDSYASDGVSGLYEFKDKSSLSITVTPGRDGYLLRQNSLELSLIECSVDGNALTNEDGTYKNQIKINKDDITVSMVGTSYSMEVQLRETEYDGLKIGNYYIIKVDGTDTKNNIISNGAQVFAIKYSPANTTPPLIKLTEPSSTALSIKNNAEVIFRGTVEYYQDELKMAAYIGDPSEDGYVVVPADKITIGNNISGGTKIKREFSFELPQSVLEDIEDGSFAVYVYAELVAAQQTGTAYVQITNDRNAPAFAEDYTITPTVEIADSEGKTVSYVNGTISIEASVSDDITLKPEVFYSLDDGANWNSLGAVTKISIKDIDTTKFADNSPKILTLKAVDGVGNESVKKITLNVNQSTDAPSVTISNADVSFNTVDKIIQTQENIFGTTSNTNLSGYITDDDGIKTIKVLWQKGSEWLENAETEQKEYDVKGKTSYSLTHRLPEQEGSYVLKIQVQDEKQEKTGFNSCVVEPFVVGVDDGAPKVNVNVENGIYLAADSTYELAGTVDDEKAVVSIYSDSACTQNIGTATVKGKAWKYKLETGSKDRSIYVQAKDGFGLKSMAEFSYKVDTAAPVFAITSVNNESGTALSKDSELISLYGSLDNYFTVKGTLADEEGGSGLEGKMYYKVCSEQDKTEDGFYNLSDGKWLNIAIKNTANGYTWELPVDFASTKYESANTFGSFNNGDSVYIYFATKDNAGNVSLIKENPSAKIKVVIDGIAPEFKDAPAIKAGLTTEIGVFAKDDETGLNEAELYLNGNKVEIAEDDGTGSGAGAGSGSGNGNSGATLEVTDGTDDNLGYKNYTFKIAAEILAKGENKITVKAYDKAGNVSESKAAVIENNAPVFMEQNTGIPSAAYKKSYGNTAASIKEFSYVTGVFASVGKLQVSGKNNSLTSFTYKDTELVLENGAYVQKTLKSATEIDFEDDSFNVTFPAAGSSELEAYEGKVVTRTFTATNVYGLESTWEINFIFDTIKPVLDINKTSIGGKNVALLSQDSDVWFNAESLVTQGEYIENGSGLSKIEYTIVDSEGKALVSDGVIYPVGKTFRSMINGFAEGSGSNTLSIKAYDNAGNESELCVYDTICIDTTKPSAKQIAANKSNDITQSLSKSENTTASENSYVWYKYEGDTEWTKCESSPVVTNRERTIILCGGYSDEASVTDGIYSGVSEVKLSVKGYESSCNLAPVFGRPDGVWTCTLEPDDLKQLFESSDSYTATILLKDSVGNSDNSTTFTFKVDKKAPEFGDFSVTPSIEVTENGKTTYTVNGTVAIETSVSDDVTLRPAVDYSLDDGTTWISIDPATKITIPGIDTTKFNDNETKKIKLRAKDEVGNEEVTEIELNVDQSTDQPKLELSTADSEIKELGVLKERQLNIFGTLSNRNLIGSISDDDGISQVTVYWQSGETWVESANTESKTYTSNGKTTYNLNHVLPGDEGSYVIKIEIKDSKQDNTRFNSNIIGPFLVGVDAGAPKLTVGASDNVFLAQGHKFTLTGTVDDAGAEVNVYSTEACTENDLLDQATVTNDSTGATWTYEIMPDSEGKTIYIQASDVFAQKATVPFKYRVDTKAPTFKITSVNNEASTELNKDSAQITKFGSLKNYFVVKGTLADEENGSGLNGSMYYKVTDTEYTTTDDVYNIDDGSWQSISIKQTPDGATWEAPIPLNASKFVAASGNTAAYFDSFKNGDKVFLYFATKDNAGNVSLIAENPSAKVKVVIDGIEPEFKAAPTVNAGLETEINVLAKDDGTSVAKTELYLNGNKVELTAESEAGTGENAGWNSYTFKLDASNLVTGENKITVKAYDELGNYKESSAVIINNNKPVLYDTESGISANAYKKNIILGTNSSKEFSYVNKVFTSKGKLQVSGTNNSLTSFTYKDTELVLENDAYVQKALKAVTSIDLDDEDGSFSVTFPAAGSSELDSYEGKFVTRTFTATNVYGLESTWEFNFVFDTKKPVLKTGTYTEDDKTIPYTTIGGIDQAKFLEDNGVWFDKGSQILEGYYDENGSGLAKIVYEITDANGNSVTSDGTIYAVGTKFSSMISGFTEGTSANILKIKAIDNAGNESSQTTYSYIKIDGTKPSVNKFAANSDAQDDKANVWYKYEGDTKWNKYQNSPILTNTEKSIELYGGYTDKAENNALASGVEKFVLTINGQPLNAELHPIADSSDGTWTYTLSVAKLKELMPEDDSYTVSIKVEDAIGNSDNSANFMFKVDSEKPVFAEEFSVTPSIDVTENETTTTYVNGTVTIETSVSDNVTLRPAVEYSLDNGTTWNSIGPVTKITIPGIDTTQFTDNETKKIKLRAKDEVGNEEVTEIPINVNQSTDKPAISISTASVDIKTLNEIVSTQQNIFGTLSNRNIIGTVTDDDGIDTVTVYWQSGESWDTSEIAKTKISKKVYNVNGKTSYSLNHELPGTEGSYVIKIEIKDSKQETTDYNSLTVEPFIVGVDAGAPKLTVGSYDDIYLAKGHDFTLDGTVDDANATVKIYSDVSCKDENLVATADVNPVTGSASAKWAYKFTVGSAGQTLYVQAKDNFGQKSIASFTYKVDTQAPTFTITNVNGKEIALSNSSELIQEYGNLSSYFTVKGNLADEENGSGLSGSMYYKVSATEDTTAAGVYDIEDGSWQSVSIKQTENGATWEAPIPLTATKFVEASGNTAAHFDSFKDGDSVYIYFATKDNAGNVSLIAENPSAKINVVIDGLKPEFKAAPDVDVQKNTIVTVLTKDNETELESAKLYLNEEAIEVTPEESAGTGDNAGWTEYKFTVNSEKLVSGENKIKVQVTDKAGNLNNSNIVTINNLAPVFKAEPAITVAKNPVISVIVKDRETSIKSTKLYINGSSLDLTSVKSAGTGENEGWECFTYTIPAAKLSNGDNKITIKAEDTSGSSTESQSIVIGNEALKFSDTETGIPAAAYRTDYGSESYYYVTKAFDMSGRLILNGENNKIDSLTYKDEYVTVNGNTESYTELKAEAEVELDDANKFTLSYPAAEASELINDYEGKFVTRTFTAKNLYGRETTWKVHFVFDTQKPVLNTQKDSSNKPYSLLGGINVTDLIAESDNWFDSESIEIKGRYKENGSGIKSINYSIVASDSSTKTGNLYTTDKGDYEEFTSIISGFVSGKDANTITIWATDNAGNKSSELQLFVNVDTTSPNLKALFCQKDEEAVTEANGTVYVNGSSNKLTVYGTYFDNESSLNALTFKLENASFEGAIVKYSESLIESEADLASAEWKDYDSVDKKAIKSWKAVFTPGETDEGEFIAHGKNIAELTEHTNSNFIIKVDNKAPKLKGTINVKQATATNSDDVYQNKTSGKYYLNNEKYTVTISGSSEDEGISGVDTVTLAVYDKDDNEVSNVIENPVVTTKDDWTFSGIDLSGIEDSATIKVTLKDKAGNSKSEELAQIIFDTQAPEAQHEFDSKNKDVYFRIGSADNEFYTETEGTGEEAHTVKYMETGDVWDDELDADVGGKYSVGTYGNDSTIEIRGTFTENEGGSGINYIYYKIFATIPTAAQITALENGTLAADGKFAPQDTPIVRRVPKNTSSGKVSKEVSNNFRQSIKGFNNTSNYLVLVAEDYAGNRKADAPTTEVPYYSINKDTTAPTITSDSSLVFTNANTNLTVSGTASDSESGIRNVTVKIDETIGGTKIEFNQVVRPGADGKWSVEIPGSTFEGITSGSLSVYAIASDNAGSGNQKQISAASVTIDNQGPEVSLVSPGEDEITGTITLKGTANDEYSNVTAIGFAIVDNRYYEKNAAGKWVLSAAAKADADEDGSIKKAAKDAAESLYNNGSPKTWQFVLDGTESSEGKKNPVLPTAEGTAAGGVANTTSGIDCAPIPEGEDYDEDSDVRKLTLVFYAKDSLGNESWTPIEGENAIFITYNPFGDRPKASVGYPTGTFATAIEDLSNLSGSIRVTGSAEDNVSMTGGAVYIQIDADKDGDFDETDKELLAAMEKSDETAIYEIVDDITAVAGVSDDSALNGAEIWGIKATGTNSWNFTMNSSNELQNSSTKVSDGVYKVGFRAVAMDGTGVLGKWSSSAYYVIDVNAPSFKNAEIYSLDSEGNAIAGQVPVSYEQDMYLSGDKSLVLTIQDEVGLKNVKYTYDTSLDTINSATRNGEITKATLDTAKTGSGPYTYEVSIPLSELGDAVHLNSTTVALKVVATKDSDTETTSYERYLVHFDNTAPQIDNLTLNSVAYEDSDKKIVNSNGYFTIGGQASDEGAGFERMSFYFMREPGTTITESRIYDVMIAPDANEADSTKQPNYISTSGLATKTVKIGTGENAESFTIYGKSQELTVSAEKSSGQTKLTGYKTDAHVRAGGYVQIGSTWHKIKKIDGENIILVTPTTALGKQTVFFAYMQSIDNTGTEKSDGLGGVSSGDDDDKMPESIIKSQTTWNYDASFFSNYIPDGPGKLVTFVYDKAGNVSAKTYNVSVQNKAPRLTKLWLSTDLNASGTFADDAESGLTEIIEYNVLGKVGEQTNYKNMKTADYKGERFIIKNKFAVIPEFTNGNGDIYMALNNAAESNSTPTALSSTEYTTQAAAVAALYSSQGATAVPDIASFTLARTGDSKLAYVIENNKVGAASYDSSDGSEKDRAMSFTFWDSTEDTISGVNSNWCYLRISDLVVNVTDQKAPNTVVEPFFWNSHDDNSLYQNSYQNGHIELVEEDSEEDPSVSGKISIRGWAFDDHTLGSIWVKFDGFTPFAGADAVPAVGNTSAQDAIPAVYDGEADTDGYYKVAAYVEKEDGSGKEWKSYAITENVAGNKWAFSVTPDYLGQAGHKVRWQLDIDTSAIEGAMGNDKKVYVRAIDETGSATGAAADVVTAHTSIPTEKGTSASSDAEYNKPSYQMDVVPYISGISTDAAGNNPATRSRLGRYPVRAGDTIYIKGFNFGTGTISVTRRKSAADGSMADATAGVETIADATRVNANTISITAPDYSGFIQLQIDNGDENLKAVNNSNDNTLGYNIEEGFKATGTTTYGRTEANTAGSNFWTDDRYLSVWNNTALKNSTTPWDGTVRKIKTSDLKEGKFYTNTSGSAVNEQNNSLDTWYSAWSSPNMMFYNSMGNGNCDGIRTLYNNSQAAFVVPVETADMAIIGGIPWFVFDDNYVGGSSANSWGAGLMVARQGYSFPKNSLNSTNTINTAENLNIVERQGNSTAADSRDSSGGYDSVLYQFKNPRITGWYDETPVTINNGNATVKYDGTVYIYVSYYDSFAHCLKYAAFKEGWSIEGVGEKWGNINGTKNFSSLARAADNMAKPSTVVAGVDRLYTASDFSENNGVDAGEWSDIMIDPSDHRPVIIYYNKTAGTLEVAHGKSDAPRTANYKASAGEFEDTTATGWTKTTSITPVAGHDFGRYVSAEIDADGNIHATAQDFTTGALYYIFLEKSGDSYTATYTLVDAECSSAVCTDITLDENSNPYISYIEQAKKNPKIAFKNNDGYFDAESDPIVYEAKEMKTSVMSNVYESTTTSNKAKAAIGFNSNMFAVDFLRDE